MNHSLECLDTTYNVVTVGGRERGTEGGKGFRTGIQKFKTSLSK